MKTISSVSSECDNVWKEFTRWLLRFSCWLIGSGYGRNQQSNSQTEASIDSSWAALSRAGSLTSAGRWNHIAGLGLLGFYVASENIFVISMNAPVKYTDMISILMSNVPALSSQITLDVKCFAPNKTVSYFWHSELDWLLWKLWNSLTPFIDSCLRWLKSLPKFRSYLFHLIHIKKEAYWEARKRKI